jgi:hypothetical protein
LSSGVQSEINLSHSRNPANHPEINPTIQANNHTSHILPTESQYFPHPFLKSYIRFAQLRE